MEQLEWNREYYLMDIVNLYKKEQKEIEELEKAICEMRDGHFKKDREGYWEDGIEKDGRYAVQYLYNDLKRKRVELNRFCNTSVKVENMPPVANTALPRKGLLE